MDAILTFVEAAVKLAPALIQAGMDIAPLVQKIVGVSQSADGPTQADWDDLAAMEKPLRDELQAPVTDA